MKFRQIVLLVFLLTTLFETSPAQGLGNSISGYVFGLNRTPLENVYIDLAADFSGGSYRTRTNGSGQYSFNGLPPGRYRVRAMPLGTDYVEQEQYVEISNIVVGTGAGRRITGMQNQQADFYLSPRRGVLPGVTGAVFAQEVPDAAKRLYQSAVSDLNEKKKAEAYASLKSAIEVFPKYFDALELLGTEYVRDGYFDAARVLLSLAVEVNPRAYRSWHGLAISFNGLKDPNQALAAVEKSVEINPIAPESLLLLGALLRQAKRYNEAEKRLLKAKEFSDKPDPDVYWELALLYGNGMKKYKEAARELKAYLKAVPDHKDAEQLRKLITEFEERAKSSS